MSDEEIAARRRAREEAGIPHPGPDPSYLQLMQDRMEMLRAEFGDALAGRRALTANEAQRLCNELYFDWEQWDVNDLWQETILDEISYTARNPHLAPSVRRVLRDGLMEFYAGGGGSQTPYDMGDLGEALFRVAEYDDYEALEAARTLLDDARTWAEAVGKQRCLRRYTRKREELFGSGAAKLGDDPLRSAKDELPEEYLEARRLAHRLVQDSHLDPARVEELARLAGSDLGDDSLNDELLARLLATYERILLRKRGVNRKVVLTIDRELVRLARDTERIHGEKLWRLWSWATAALGKRASDEMRKYVDRELGRVKVEFVRAALWRAARAIFPKQTQAPAAGRSPTTAPATMPASAE